MCRTEQNAESVRINSSRDMPENIRNGELNNNQSINQLYQFLHVVITFNRNKSKITNQKPCNFVFLIDMSNSMNRKAFLRSF